MICIIALIVFGILAIFSASHRPLAKEAFDCVFRKITFRKCQTNLDQRIKTGITGKLMTKSPRVARFTHKNFEILSWIFTIILIWSIIQSGIGVYNLAVYNNCNGEQGDYCVLTGEDEFGSEAVSTLQECGCSECNSCEGICDCSSGECKELKNGNVVYEKK